MPDKQPPHPPFSKDNQPKKRKSKNPLTDILKGMLDMDTKVILEGKLIETLSGGRVKVEVSMPTKEAIVAATMRGAMKLHPKAMETVWERIEGKVVQPIEDVTKEQKQYDLSKLPPELHDEFTKTQSRYSELLALCEVGLDEDSSGE